MAIYKERLQELNNFAEEIDKLQSTMSNIDIKVKTKNKEIFEKWKAEEILYNVNQLSTLSEVFINENKKTNKSDTVKALNTMVQAINSASHYILDQQSNAFHKAKTNDELQAIKSKLVTIKSLNERLVNHLISSNVEVPLEISERIKSIDLMQKEIDSKLNVSVKKRMSDVPGKLMKKVVDSLNSSSTHGQTIVSKSKQNKAEKAQNKAFEMHNIKQPSITQEASEGKKTKSSSRVLRAATLIKNKLSFSTDKTKQDEQQTKDRPHSLKN